MLGSEAPQVRRSDPGRSFIEHVLSGLQGRSQASAGLGLDDLVLVQVLVLTRAQGVLVLERDR